MTWHGLFLQDPSDHPHKVTSHCLSQTVYNFYVKRLNQHDHLNQNCYFQILCQVGSIVTGISTIFRQHNLPQHQQRFDEIDLVAPFFHRLQNLVLVRSSRFMTTTRGWWNIPAANASMSLGKSIRRSVVVVVVAVAVAVVVVVVVVAMVVVVVVVAFP